MSVKVIDNSPKILLNITQKSNLFIRFMLDEIYKDARPITPKDKGDLRNNILKSVKPNFGTITWKQRYAAAQEVGTVKGHKIRKYTTPGTGPHYAERAIKSAEKKAPVIAKRVGLI